MQNKNNSTPTWLRILLIAGGTILIGYLLAKLLEYLFEDEKPEKTKRVFISHSWKQDKDYWTLIKRFEYYNFNFYNHSIPEEKAVNTETAAKIEKSIRNKIQGCSKVLVLACPYANNYWIKKEIEIAKELKKEVIAIRPWNQKGIPKYLENNADKIIGFNANAIIETIKNQKICHLLKPMICF